MNKRHEITNIKIENDSLIITVDGQTKEFKLKDISKKLFEASEAQRVNFVVSPSGYGIHWPLIDEDVSIDALLGTTNKPKFIKAA